MMKNTFFAKSYIRPSQKDKLAVTVMSAAVFCVFCYRIHFLRFIAVCLLAA